MIVSELSQIQWISYHIIQEPSGKAKNRDIDHTFHKFHKKTSGMGKSLGSKGFFLPCFIVLRFFSGNRRVSRIFGLLKMVILGDEGNMVEHVVEIDARVFWTLISTSRHQRAQVLGKQWFLDAKQR